MKFFVDTANLADIEDALKRGFVRGVTTNPSLLAKEPKSNFEAHIKKIITLIKKYQKGAHLSIEVFSTNSDEILKQARRFKKVFNYSSLSIKIQTGWNELEIINRLSKEGFSVNCTACMTVSQAIMAAQAGARYVSLFWGRIRDGGLDTKFSKQRKDLLATGALDKSDFSPKETVKRTRELLDKSDLDAEIIVGSIRTVTDIRDAILAGAHIVTIQPKFFRDMASHYKTDEVVKQFLSDFKKWMA